MSVKKVDEEKCTGCGICVACCPQDVFRMDRDTGKSQVKYPKDCVACWTCESFCPPGCIDVSPERGRGELPYPY